MTAHTATLATVQVATLEDSIPSIPNPDNIGLNATLAAAISNDTTNGVIFPNTEKEILFIRSASASEVIVTVIANTCSQGYTTVHNNVSHIAIGSGTTKYKILGPFSNNRWGNLTGAGAPYGTGADELLNHVRVTFDSYADVSYAILQVPRTPTQ